MIDADELMEQLLSGEDLEPHELLGLSDGKTEHAKVEEAYKERVALLGRMMAVPQFARYVPQCEAMLQEAKDALLDEDDDESETEDFDPAEVTASEAMTVPETPPPKKSASEAMTVREIPPPKKSAKPSRPSRGALRQKEQKELSKKKDEGRRATFLRRVREKVLEDGKLSSKNFIEACKVGKKVGLSPEDIGELVNDAQEECYFWMVDSLVKQNIHDGILGRVTEKKIRKLCEEEGIPPRQAKGIIGRSLKENGAERMPKLSEEGASFRKEAVNRIKSLGNTSAAERVLMRLGQTSGAEESEWRAIVHDLFDSLRLPKTLKSNASDSPEQDELEDDEKTFIEAKHAKKKVAAIPDEDEDDEYEIIGGGDDDEDDYEPEEVREKPKPKKKKKKKSSGVDKSSPATERNKRSEPALPPPPQSKIGMFVGIGFGLFGMGALLAVGFLIFAGKGLLNQPPPAPATTAAASTIVPARPVGLAGGNVDSVNPVAENPVKGEAGNPGDGEGVVEELPKVKVQAGPKISPAAALEFIGKALEKQGSERQKNAEMAQDICVLSFARALGVAVWTGHNAEAAHWLDKAKKTTLTRDVERSILTIKPGKDAPAEPDDEDLILKVMRRTNYASRSVGEMLKGFSWADEPDMARPVFHENPLEKDNLMDRQLYDQIKTTAKGYEDLLAGNPKFQTLRGRTQSDFQAKVDAAKNKDYVLDKFLTTTYLQRACNKQFSAVEWLAMNMKLNGSRVARETEIKLNTMYANSEKAVTPLGQLRAGLITELRLLTSLLKKKR
ncbi:MAG: hypothetical protein QGG53_35560 [Planctomycetota bacterium]|jgi:hypothetical protein|nr:hypothetical protein [Planctomycetota bacterium]